MLHSASFNKLRDILPRADRLAPHWIVEDSAQTEMDALQVSQNQIEAVINVHPLPSIIMEFKSWAQRVPVALLNASKGTSLYKYAITRGARPAEGLEFDPDGPRVFICSESGVEDYASERQLYVILGQAAAYYAIRCHFAERYINKIRTFSGRSKPILDTVPGPVVITVKWDAPTPKYIGHDPNHVVVPTGRKMPRYTVDGFERHYKSGKVSWVRPHHRGDDNVPRKTILRVI